MLTHILPHQRRQQYRREQRGITLVLALIMLILLTTVSVSVFNLGKGDLQLVDNAQQRAQAHHAAQAILDQLVSSTNFANNSSTALSNANCPTALKKDNSTCIDLYGDSKTVINVQLSPNPACVQNKTVTTAELNLNNTEDLGCAVGIAQKFGIANTSATDSLCADSMWEINAIATEATSTAQVVITEGVKLRVSIDAVSTSCP